MDARITMDIFVRFDKKYNVFSNGERIEVRENTDNTRTWHYKMARNHPFFSTSLVIGDYDFKTSKSAGGVPLEYWYYQGQEEKGRKFIFINALCAQRDRQGLDKKIVITFDGGTCYFNVKYDPGQKVFFDLFINGEA